MPVYFVFHNRVLDVEKYAEYRAKVAETLMPYDFEMLVLADSSEVIEGDTDLPRTVIVKFKSRDDAMAWYKSSAYQALLSTRLEATEGYGLLVNGFS